MPAVYITDRYQAIQYTGGNSATVDAAITDFTIISETGGVLTASSGGNNWTISTNDWVRYTQGFVASVHSPAAFATLFLTVASSADLLGLQAQVDAVASDSVSGVGLKESPTLLFGQSANVDVDIHPTQAGDQYTPLPQLVAASSALGSLSITGTSVLDADTVRVTVQNSGLVNLSGVHVLVTVTP